MGVFEHFPYVNFHELNFSWMIAKIKELEDVIGSQIVDIVARAGVAANAQAIQDLTTTVEDNAVTAHNEAQAAQTTANTAVTNAATAQTAANTAQNGVNTLNTRLTRANGVLTPEATISNIDGDWSKFGSMVSVTYVIVNGSADLPGGTSLIGTGLPTPYYRPYQFDASVYIDGSFTKSVRCMIDYDGSLKLWYGGSLPANAVLIVACTYETQLD